MKDFVKDVCVVGIAAVIVLQFVQPTRVFGISMQPTFHQNDYLIVSKEAYAKTQPKRGDVVVFQSKLLSASGQEELLIKRIIGLPGDTVLIEDGNVYINGDMIADSYTKDKYTNGYMSVKVPKGSYFCMGDNRLHSTDSRFESVGYVKMNQIKGKVVFRLFPFNKVGRIGSH